MMRFVPWLLVALCFVLGVASRSIGDSFPVFVPALEKAFEANRGDITIIYSFALLVGGISGPVNGWILDRLGLRALTVLGMTSRPPRRSSRRTRRRYGTSTSRSA